VINSVRFIINLDFPWQKFMALPYLAALYLLVRIFYFT